MLAIYLSQDTPRQQSKQTTLSKQITSASDENWSLYLQYCRYVNTNQKTETQIFSMLK
jgi:hypothetical protein